MEPEGETPTVHGSEKLNGGFIIFAFDTFSITFPITKQTFPDSYYSSLTTK